MEEYIADEKTAYIRAKTRVDPKVVLHGNLISYCIVIPILIIINLNTSSNFGFIPMSGWGIICPFML
jgi:hypothetical protein